MDCRLVRLLPTAAGVLFLVGVTMLLLLLLLPPPPPPPLCFVSKLWVPSPPLPLPACEAGSGDCQQSLPTGGALFFLFRTLPRAVLCRAVSCRAFLLSLLSLFFAGGGGRRQAAPHQEGDAHGGQASPQPGVAERALAAGDNAVHVGERQGVCGVWFERLGRYRS